MKIQFISKIRIANKSGTGFLKLPVENSNLFKIGDHVEVFLDQQKFPASVIKWGNVGIYVPREIAKDLLEKKINAEVKIIQENYAKVGYDGRIYIPLYLAKNLSLKDKDIIYVKIFQDNGFREKYSQLNVRKRGRKIEYMCMAGKDLAKKRIRFTIERKHSDFTQSKKFIDLSNFLNKTNFAITQDNKLIVFSRKLPIIINPEIKLSGIALYLGAYYSDGTKKGNNWAICASTFEQARFYLKTHRSLIKNSIIELIISYTNTKNESQNKVVNNLKIAWIKNFGSYPYKFRIRKPSGTIFTKCTKYGTLTMREHRIGLLDFYNYLVENLIEEIRKNNNKSLAIDFLCGILEGDGSVPAKKRGHIEIATNSKEYRSLANVLEVLEIKHRIIKYGENKYAIRIGALEILRNFDHLKDKIFIYYPKRRRMLFERLQTVGAVKFLIVDHEPSSWVKSWLKENGFVDNNYKLTPKGRKLKRDLRKCIKSATVK